MAAVSAAAACSTATPGAPEPAASTVDTTPGITRTPADLLLPVDRFPEAYPAVVLPPQAVSQAAPDLTGIHPGSKVEPAGCLPPSQDYGPDATAMAVGTAEESRATISVEVTTRAVPLADTKTHLSQCSRVEATRRGVTAVVETRPDSPPPTTVPGVETLAFTRTVSSGGAGETVTQSTVARVGQLGSVRVTATYMTFDSEPVDTAELDLVFGEALRHAAQP